MNIRRDVGKEERMDNKMNKPIALTPPMGWNSWNTFTWDINEKMICEMADRMVETDIWKPDMNIWLSMTAGV